jgi:hypothetical protein
VGVAKRVVGVDVVGICKNGEFRFVAPNTIKNETIAKIIMLMFLLEYLLIGYISFPPL